MNLYFRLIWLLLRFPWMPKQTDVLKASTLMMRVMPNDLDLNFHVNNGRFLTIMDLGRLHLAAITGILMPALKRGWLPVLGSAKIHFIRPLNMFDQFKMISQVIYWDEKWLYFEQKIFKQEELCAVALFKALFTSKQGKITPDQLLQLVPNPPSQPSIPDIVKHWQDAEKLSKS